MLGAPDLCSRLIIFKVCPFFGAKLAKPNIFAAANHHLFDVTCWVSTHNNTHSHGGWPGRATDG